MSAGATAGASASGSAAGGGATTDRSAAGDGSTAAGGASGMAIESSGRWRFGGGGIDSSEVLDLGRADESGLGLRSAARGMGADIWMSGLCWASGVHDATVRRKVARRRKGLPFRRGASGGHPNSSSCHSMHVRCEWAATQSWRCSSEQGRHARVHRRSAGQCPGRRSRAARR